MLEATCSFPFQFHTLIMVVSPLIGPPGAISAKCHTPTNQSAGIVEWPEPGGGWGGVAPSACDNNS